jgi:hypothetical protein
VQELTPLLKQQTNDVQEVGAIACRLARDSFRPVTMFILNLSTRQNWNLNFRQEH